MLEKLVNNTDTTLFRELNDCLFQQKSLDVIIKEYVTNVKNGVYKDSEKIKNAKFDFQEAFISFIDKYYFEIVEHYKSTKDQVYMKHIENNTFDID